MVNMIPKKQGLYDPRFEHDACGIGILANIDGTKAHSIVVDSLNMLDQMAHRGGQDFKDKTGDGAGILTQIPDELFRMWGSLPEAGHYAVGMIFLPQDLVLSQECARQFEAFAAEEGLNIIGWREVPFDDRNIGEKARKAMPMIRQVFVERSPEHKSQDDFEKRLYIVRKQVESWAKQNEEIEGHSFYIASLSSRTIVYKGMFTPEQLANFYTDFQHDLYKSAMALVHSRFSTNTFPSWHRAHPNRYVIHNGEINTLTGNVNALYAREKSLESEVFGEELPKVLPIADESGSDSSILDNTFEFLTRSGRSMPEVASLLVPEPWEKNKFMSDEMKAYYEYNSSLMEPWDGPMALGFSDGRQIGALLDRNGLRPARYYVTDDGRLVFASEVGVLPIEEEKIIKKSRLGPGQMLLVDLEEGKLYTNDEIKSDLAKKKPYQKWIREHVVNLNNKAEKENGRVLAEDTHLQRQKAYGYTHEEIDKNLIPMVVDGKDPIGAMGNDSPLAVLSNRPQLLYNYFKQHFAQVTNPPIDALREEVVTSTMTWLGSEGNLLHPTENNCHRIKLKGPIIDSQTLIKLKKINDFKARKLSILFDRKNGSQGLGERIEQLFVEAETAIEEGASLLILTDQKMSDERVAIPSLLAVSAVHNHLVRKGIRTKASLILETGEARDVHQFCVLLGYGVDAINPYLAIETIENCVQSGKIENKDEKEAVAAYIATATEGVVKVLSKMGISTIQSYRGAQIFEAIGLGEDIINTYFPRTASQIDGIPLEVIAEESMKRHDEAFRKRATHTMRLDSGSDFQWRKEGEYHRFNPETIHMLQKAARNNSYEDYKTFTRLADEEELITIRSLLTFNKQQPSIPLSEVESVEAIFKRFKTGAMSYGSLSQEAHEALAIAMNRIGGKSNSGEGGEDTSRFQPDENGDLRRSAIKQVASGRFGVTSHYLTNADEIQIKMAQGAKPGEGGHLPGKKVYPWIAEVRGSTPGVGLISPPPHHDIYSIEDLAQLIYDLKNSNPGARINVKLVSKAGVGTIAAGVAKGLADVILISGYEGGTGASPKTSIRHAGLPWELGLAETHQTLLLNGLRDRVTLETDGKLMTGRDVITAALLGAEEYGFSTAPLVVLGCIIMRACHLNTCPVGIATQDPELRKKFMGDPQHIVNYLTFIAEEMREIMAELGVRNINELIGRTDLLKLNERAKNHWKAKYINLSKLLYMPEVPESYGRYKQVEQDYGIEKTLDYTALLPISETALREQKRVQAILPITNENRTVGTLLGHEVTKLYGEAGLPDNTIWLNFKGSAGQTFGGFIPKGVTLHLEGDANDYVGKGLSGGRLIVHPSAHSQLNAEEQMIIGNVAFYGATAGEAFISGRAGERFAVRNSGADIVVEGVGQHGCEYMTGGHVVVLGSVGQNFAAGMSGGIAYILNDDGEQNARFNDEMVYIEAPEEADLEKIQLMIEKHVLYTNSKKAMEILDQWELYAKKFTKVIPREFKKMLRTINRVKVKEAGLTEEEAVMKAFKIAKSKTKVEEVKSQSETI